MPVCLLVFEFLGTTELIVIAAVALLIFGPRKLPEIGRTIGKSLAEFKRASEDFKRTWEYEVEMERSERDLRAAPPSGTNALPESSSASRPETVADGGDGGDGGDAPAATEEYTVARGATFEPAATAGDEERLAASHDAAAERHAEESAAAGGKKDWL